MVTEATQRRPSGFSTRASTPSKLSPCSTARAMGVASGGMNWPDRVSTRKEPQNRWAGSNSRGVRPHSSAALRFARTMQPSLSQT